jgi:hypothetical protein
MERIWQPRPGEPDAWHFRFVIYWMLGSERTLAAAYHKANIGVPPSKRALLATWERVAKRWEWAARAKTLDGALDRLALTKEISQPLDPNAERRTNIDLLLAAVFKALRQANLGGMEQEEVRQLLPTLRTLLRDLLAAQRAEAQLLAAGQEGELTPFSADELRHAQLELEQWRADKWPATVAGQLPPGALSAPGEPAFDAPWMALRDVLAGLYPDEASMRRIAAQAGLAAGRISFSAQAVNNWHAVLTEAEHSNRVDELMAVVQGEYGANPLLAKALADYRNNSRRIHGGSRS